MRIGVSGGAPSVERVVEQVRQAEADGFTSVWFPGAVGGDPLVAMAIAGRATSRIELGTSILQTYPCHPVLQANRVAAAAQAMGRPGFTLGLGPSHDAAVERGYGLSYAHVGRHTEEYVQLVTALLRGETVDFEGEELTARATGIAADVTVMVAALAPRLLRVAGTYAAGTITWMANSRAIRELIVPRIRAAADAAGRPSPRIVVGLPVAVHDDVEAARAAAAEQFVIYGRLPNYQRVLAAGGLTEPRDAVLVGDESTLRAAVEELFAAGATDLWAAPFPVGEDRAASRKRTRAFLVELANA